MGKSTAKKEKSTTNVASRRSNRKKGTAGKKEAEKAGVIFEALQKRTNDFEHVIKEIGNCKTIDINMNSEDFQNKQEAIFSDFVCFCKNSSYYSDHMELVEFKNKAGKIIMAPELFVACACENGLIEKDKVNLANQVYTDFVKQMKMKKKGMEGLDYQPNSQSTLLRSLMGLMKERYMWNYTMKTFHFTGGLAMVVSRLFQSRLKRDKTNTVSIDECEYGNMHIILTIFFTCILYYYSI